MFRFADVTCSAHRAERIEGWALPEGASPLGTPATQQCEECRALIMAAADESGNVAVRVLPWLPITQYQTMTAVHEAAHAVIGVIGGLDLQEVHMADDTGRGGRNVYPATLHNPVGRITAMAWAGQLANRRWLEQRYSLTEADLLDVAYLGSGDTAMIEQVAEQADVHPRYGRTAASRLLATAWDRIIGVAEELERANYLTGAQVRELLTEELVAI